MGSFEILCATMHQKDFSKIKEMNIHADVIIANQADRNCVEEMEFDGHRARMVTTQTCGVTGNTILKHIRVSESQQEGKRARED